MDEDDALDEIIKIKEKLSLETVGMTSDEYLRYIKKNAKEFQAERERQKQNNPPKTLDEFYEEFFKMKKAS